MSDIEISRARAAARPLVTLSEAIRQGLAPDGGLYVPTRLPRVDPAAFDGAHAPARNRARARSRVSSPAIGCSRCSARSPMPRSISRRRRPAILKCPDPLFVLELFHGPTAAFKDFGARFLAETLQRLQAGSEQPLTILVATSGDTGGAVAAAFHLRPWVRIVILYPKGLVSARQEQQLTCWGDNVISLRIDGTFDDCQRLVKEAFVDSRLRRKHRFSSANSINIGRLLPQMVYYVASSLEVERRTGAKASLHHSGRQPRQRIRRRMGARPGIPHRAHHLGAQRQSHGARFSARPANGVRGRASRRSPPPWMSAIPAIWSAFARFIRPSIDQRTLERGERR